MKKLVGYGFILPSKPSSFDERIFHLFKFLFVGRLKPYPTEFKKHDNLPYFSQKLFFNVKITKKP
jgi:hypothetical protein